MQQGYLTIVISDKCRKINKHIFEVFFDMTSKILKRQFSEFE